MFLSSSYTSIPLLFLTFGGTFVNAQACYWGNGTKTTDIVACSNGSVIQCCRPGNACLNNGLCFDPGAGRLYRGGCTVADWVTEDKKHCPTWCTDSDGPADITYCDQVTGASQFWCSNAPKDPSPHCQSPLYAWPGPLGGDTPSVTQLNATAAAANTTNGAPASSATGTSAAGTSGAANVSKKCKSNNSVAIGAGVGVPLGVLVLGLLAFLFTRKQKKQTVVADEPRTETFTTEEPKMAPAKAGTYEIGSHSMPTELPASETNMNGSHHMGKY